jgi:hypothetical protein
VLAAGARRFMISRLCTPRHSLSLYHPYTTVYMARRIASAATIDSNEDSDAVQVIEEPRKLSPLEQMERDQAELEADDPSAEDILGPATKSRELSVWLVIVVYSPITRNTQGARAQTTRERQR